VQQKDRVVCGVLSRRDQATSSHPAIDNDHVELGSDGPWQIDIARQINLQIAVSG
jgi:hypothetical protein